MNVKTRISKLCYFTCQQFNPLYRVTKYDALIYLQLKKKKKKYIKTLTEAFSEYKLHRK